MSACSLFYKIKSNDMKNTGRKRNMREIRIVPQGAVALANGEAARPGQAVAAVNVREREQSLQVTGLPVSRSHDHLPRLDGEAGWCPWRDD